jgi:hypothetical protein
MRGSLVACAVAATVSAVLGCSRSTSEAATDDSAALVDSTSAGSIAWNIDPGGSVRATVKTPDGKPITENVDGTMVWKTVDGPKTVVLSQDKKSGALVAAGPKLDGDLTEIDYTVVAPAKPLSGTLFLPRGGTPELVAAAKAPPAVVVPEGKKGPHGGPIQIVGKDRLEIVASRKGEVRVYVLDANLQPVPIGTRKVQLGVGGNTPEVVMLTPAASGLYFVGHWKASGEPARLTLEERDGDDVRVIIVGHKPGTPFVVVGGASGPPVIAVVVVEEFDREHGEGDDDDKDHGDRGDHGDHGDGPKGNGPGGRGGPRRP